MDEVVLIGGDGAVRAAVAQAVAAADLRLHETAGEPSVRAWTRARAVVVCGDAPAELPRRRGVFVAGARVGEEELRVAVAVGAEAAIALPEEGARLVTALARCGDPVRSGRTVIVVGGCGGAGASVLAAAVAGAAARTGEQVVLCDLDPWGGGIDLLLGLEETPGVRWPQVRVSRGRVAGRALVEVLPGGAAGPAVLAVPRGEVWAPEVRAVTGVLAGLREIGAAQVWDVPVGTAADVLEPLVGAADEVLVPAVDSLRATAAAHAVVRHLRGLGAEPRLVVRRASRAPLDPEDVADLAEAPLVAAYRSERALESRLAEGTAPERATRSLARLATLLAERAA